MIVLYNILKNLFYHLYLYNNNNNIVKKIFSIIELVIISIILCYLNFIDNNIEIYEILNELSYKIFIIFLIINFIQITSYIYDYFYDNYIKKNESEEDFEDYEEEYEEEYEDEFEDDFEDDEEENEEIYEENEEDEKFYLDLNLPNHYYDLKNSNDTTIDDIKNEMNILYENSENIKSSDYLNQSNYLKRIYLKIKNKK